MSNVRRIGLPQTVRMRHDRHFVDRLVDSEFWRTRYLGGVQLRGKTVITHVHEVLFRACESDAKRRTLPLFCEGVRLREAGQADRARELFQQVLARDPADRAARFLADERAA